MSQTFHFVCEDCKAELWVGQGWKPDRVYLYTTEHAVADLTRFVFKHERHQLRFLETQELPDDLSDESTDR